VICCILLFSITESFRLDRIEEFGKNLDIIQTVTHISLASRISELEDQVKSLEEFGGFLLFAIGLLSLFNVIYFGYKYFKTRKA